MIEAYRIVENQSQLYGFRSTKSAKKAAYVDFLLEATKPQMPYQEWHRLIATPFRYPLPSPHQARFRPPYFQKNVLYCSQNLMTTLYEHAYHFMKERMHLEDVRESGQRTAFSLFIEDSAVTDIHEHPKIAAIMARDDYAASHEFIKARLEIRVICYPSCRDPKHGPNYAALDIMALGKEIGDERALSFYFDQAEQSVYWTDMGLKIFWNDVN